MVRLGLAAKQAPERVLRVNPLFNLSCRAYKRDSRFSIFKHSLSSLKVDSLKSSDFVDLSNGSKLSLHFSRDLPPLSLMYDTAFTPFPSNARGFLYYHVPPPSSPLAGAIRLRIDSDGAAGNDLLLPNGLPWQVGLPTLVKHEHGRGALALLLSEGLVDAETVENCRAVFSGRSLIMPKRLLFALDQPFATSMTDENLYLVVVGKKHLERLRIRALFGWGHNFPFRGSLLARFELSPDGLVVFIRTLKIIEPIVSANTTTAARVGGGKVVAPVEGHLISRRMSDGVLHPWSLSLSENIKASALRLLIDR
ncbi:hypothetical protein MIND_00208800 [Mycena indigotica]|uniref:Uncharacterized protein n=1 Tax=Mycena indigotica TaxID=2126181 RepID=A0A8H6WD01_9AGAR|nr:uncharacterized protein MIND_00208800 [Mycena indigotica]KAF7311971.1 hypothetical protein MIND_00208800 [Mycena indigotica]